jgi:hypothetical protein
MTGRSVHQNGHFDSQFDEPSVLYRPLHDEVTETWDGVHTKQDPVVMTQGVPCTGVVGRMTTELPTVTC